MAFAKMTSKGQVTIPLSVRLAAHIKTGTLLDFHIESDGTITIRALTKDLMHLKGIVKTKRKTPVSIEEMDIAIQKGAAKRSHGSN